MEEGVHAGFSDGSYDLVPLEVEVHQERVEACQASVYHPTVCLFASLRAHSSTYRLVHAWLSPAFRQSIFYNVSADEAPQLQTTYDRHNANSLCSQSTSVEIPTCNV